MQQQQHLDTPGSGSREGLGPEEAGEARELPGEGEHVEVEHLAHCEPGVAP